MTAPNEMQVAMILLAIVMPILGCALNATLNIKIKFAADAAQANREKNRILLRVVSWIVNLYSAGFLLWLFFVPPLSKFSLVGILSCCFTLHQSLITFGMDRVMDRLIDFNTTHLDFNTTHLDLTKGLVDHATKQTDLSDQQTKIATAIIARTESLAESHAKSPPAKRIKK